MMMGFSEGGRVLLVDFDEVLAGKCPARCQCHEWQSINRNSVVVPNPNYLVQASTEELVGSGTV